MDYQVGNKGTALSIDDAGNIQIDLQKMCGNQKEAQLSEDFAFMMQRSVLGDNENILSPQMESKGLAVRFNSNKVTIMMGDKV